MQTCRLDQRERYMSKFAIRLLTVAMFSMALVAVPAITSAYASGDEFPSAPAAAKTKEAKEGDKSSAIEDQKVRAGCRTAYATLYVRNDYAAAIAQLQAL